MLPAQLRAKLFEPGINPVDAMGSYWPTTGLGSRRAVRGGSSCSVALASRGMIQEVAGSHRPAQPFTELSDIQICYFLWHSEEELC